MIAGPEGVFTAEERLSGYREAFKEAGIPQCEELIVPAITKYRGISAAS